VTLVVLEQMAFEIAERLRPSCAHLPTEELESLALRMAAIELKYLGLTSPSLKQAGSGFLR
jgi:hypothetical protein